MQTALSVSLCVFAWVFFMLMVVMLVLQTYLLSKNLTTYEFLKDIYKDYKNPFDVACCANWKVFCMLSSQNT